MLRAHWLRCAAMRCASLRAPHVARAHDAPQLVLRPLVRSSSVVRGRLPNGTEGTCTVVAHVSVCRCSMSVCAFVTVSVPFPSLRRAPRAHRRRRSPRASSQQPSDVSLDPLNSFESFCRRAQQSLASDAADADGLGTFAPPPASLSHAEPRTDRVDTRLEMRGGRAFRAAVVDVWRSARSVPVRRARVLTCADERGDSQFRKESVGISLNLTPWDDSLPALRADAHYFQIGGEACLAWWFAGTADLSVGARASPRRFASLVAPFLDTWERLKSRHRLHDGARKTAFLDMCWASDERLPSPIQRLDRDTSFLFITEMFDSLLPAYLPLLAARGGVDVAFADWHGFELTHALREDGAFGKETVETFCLSGGASCESTTLRANPLGSWRFSLAPSSLTSAGKVYDTLRSDGRSACPSLLYIDFA